MTSPIDRPEIDFLILAERAEGVNGKLYMMGGGWDQYHIRDFGKPITCSIALGVLIPWACTNEEYPLRVQIEDEDRNPISPPIAMGVNMGRPPIAVKGQTFRAIIVIQGEWLIPRPGSYSVVAVLEERNIRRVTFHALAGVKENMPA